MCEFAYVADLDNNTLEVYEGFNKEPVTEGRFLSGDNSLESTDGYEPVIKIKEFDLLNLPSNEQFLFEIDSVMDTD